MNEDFSTIIKRRLRECVKFWNASLETYSSLEEFLPNVNALIQSLRNLTFIIQAHKNLIPDFEEWYAKKQDDMRADDTLRWLVEKRNQITKQKDLELKSIAKVYVSNWEDVDLGEFTISPIKSNEEIRDKFVKSLDDHRKDLVYRMREPLLQIERTWIENDSEEKEFLGLLAHCYCELRDVVKEALVLFGENVEDFHIDGEEALLLDSVPRESRTIYIDLKDGGIMKMKKKDISLDAKESKKAVRRYGLKKMPIESKDPKELFDYIKKIAHVIVQRDGCHVAMVWYLYDDDKISHQAIPTEDKTQQYRIIRKIASDIRTERIKGLIFVLDEWLYNVDKKGHKLNKGEAVAITYLSKEGEYKSDITPYIRKPLGKITLEESIIETDLSRANWLKPIRDAWKLE